MPNHPPPLYTLLVDLVGWTLDRTAAIPKAHRFTFGQRLDNLTLEALDRCIIALYSPPPEKPPALRSLNLALERLRALWRLVADRRWIGARQLLFVNARIDDIGRQAGAWLRSLAAGKEVR